MGLKNVLTAVRHWWIRWAMITENIKRMTKKNGRTFFWSMFFGPVEVSYITSMLEEAGIFYRVSEEGSGNYMNILMGQSFAGQDIWVGEDDYDRAAEIVASYQNAVAEEDAPNDDDTAD